MSDLTAGKVSAGTSSPRRLRWSAIAQASFFRQSGWMLFATTLSGVFFYAVHFFAGRKMDPDEYGVFNTLLQVVNQMAIPSVGLLTIFVQQAALAESAAHRRELAGAVRSVLRASGFFWLVTVGLVFLFQSRLQADYKIQHPLALWATVALGLVSLWAPIMQGILQGRQNFLWLGMIPMVSAFTRLVLVAVIVTLLASARFSPAQVKDPAGLAEKLRSTADPVSRCVWDRFPAETRRALTSPGLAVGRLEAVLIDGLNRTLQGPSLFEPERFAGVRLSKESRLRLTQSLEGEELERLNRLLLEDAYPGEIVRHSREPRFSGSDFKDLPGLAVKLSTGSGAISGYLWRRFSAPARRVLQNPPSSPDQRQAVLIAELNRILKGPALFEADGFDDLPLSAETRRLLTRPPKGADLVRLNRRLLEDAYPREIGANPRRSRQAAGAMVGVLLSMVAALGLGVRQTLPLWRGEASGFSWTPWLKKVVPLTLGMGSSTFMFTIDMLAVQRFLPESGTYGAAGMIGRALVFLVAPLTMVMFPKIVQAAARAERTDVLLQALGATALMAGCAAVFCTFWPHVPIRIVQGEKYLAAAPLVRWFAWCVLPLMVSSVLVNNLMARERYDSVPWLVAVAALYGFALWQPAFHASHVRVIQTLGLFALLYFGVCLVFTWRKKPGLPVPSGSLRPPAV